MGHYLSAEPSPAPSWAGRRMQPRARAVQLSETQHSDREPCWLTEGAYSRGEGQVRMSWALKRKGSRAQ